MRGDLERHSLDNLNPLRVKQSENSPVANVFLAERGFIFRNSVTFEIGARRFDPGCAIGVRMYFRRPLIAASAPVNEVIGIGGQFGQIKRLEDTRIVLIAPAEQGRIPRDGVAFEIEALGVELRGAIGFRVCDQRIAVRFAIDERLDFGGWIGPRRRFFTHRRAGQSNRDKSECREDHVSHLSPPAQKPYRFAALENIEQQSQCLAPRAFEARIFIDDLARFVARQVQQRPVRGKIG